MKSFDIMDVIYYLILAAIILAIIMRANNFKIAVGAVDSSLNSTLGVLSGSGYQS